MAKLSERTENARVRGNHRPGRAWVSTRGVVAKAEPFSNVTSVH